MITRFFFFEIESKKIKQEKQKQNKKRIFTYYNDNDGNYYKGKDDFHLHIIPPHPLSYFSCTSFKIMSLSFQFIY